MSPGQPRAARLSLSGAAFLLVFFASGFAALLYQIIWQYVPVFERLAAGAYYARGGISIDDAMRPCLERPATAYGPGFDRTRLVDLNRDLFPKDEFVIPRAMPPD